MTEKKQDQEQQEKTPTDLLSALADMRNGMVVMDLNQKFNDLLGAVLDTGGKGELTIKIFVRPAKFGLGRSVLEVELEHEVKMKKPELPVGEATFFVTKDGRLTRNDPAQEEMFAQEKLQ